MVCEGKIGAGGGSLRAEGGGKERWYLRGAPVREGGSLRPLKVPPPWHRYPLKVPPRHRYPLKVPPRHRYPLRYPSAQVPPKVPPRHSTCAGGGGYLRGYLCRGGGGTLGGTCAGGGGGGTLGAPWQKLFSKAVGTLGRHKFWRRAKILKGELHENSPRSPSN